MTDENFNQKNVTFSGNFYFDASHIRKLLNLGL